jgi:hypothetical protein
VSVSVHSDSKTASRRALLAGALGGIGAWAAGAIGRVSTVRATNGDPVHVAGSYTATGTTQITNSSGTAPVFIAESQAGGVGAWGRSDTSSGVIGESGTGIGVHGTNQLPTTDPAVLGLASNSTGVLGHSGGQFDLPDAKAKTGVFGHASQDSASKGVWGNSPEGHGIHGESSTGWAGFFDGRVLASRYMEMVEIGTPTAPGGNRARLFIRDNGSGKTQLCVRFHTGAVKVLATQT